MRINQGLQILIGTLLTVGAMASTGASDATALIDWNNSRVYVRTDYTTTGANVFNVPDGSGAMLYEAVRSVSPYQLIDATIYVDLRDSGPNGGNRITTGYVKEDVWLQTSLGGLVACPNSSNPGTFASVDIGDFQSGGFVWSTLFNGPLHAGGFTGPGEVVEVFANTTSGMKALQWQVDTTHFDGSSLSFNSPDYDGTGLWLRFAQYFAEDFFGGTYQFRSDMFHDGVINLTDVVPFAEGIGSKCDPQ